jgi:hypothetical protein
MNVTPRTGKAPLWPYLPPHIINGGTVRTPFLKLCILAEILSLWTYAADSLGFVEKIAISPSLPPSAHKPIGLWKWDAYQPLHAPDAGWGEPWRQQALIQANPITVQARWQQDTLSYRNLQANLGPCLLTLGDISTSRENGLPFLEGRGYAPGWQQASSEALGEGENQGLLFSGHEGLNGIKTEWKTGKVPWQVGGGWNQLLLPKSDKSVPADAGLFGIATQVPLGDLQMRSETMAYRLEQRDTLLGATVAQGFELANAPLTWSVAAGGLIHRNRQATLKSDGYFEATWKSPPKENIRMTTRCRWAGEDWLWPLTPDMVHETSSQRSDTAFPAPARGESDWMGTVHWPLWAGDAGEIRAEGKTRIAWDKHWNWREFRVDPALAWQGGRLHLKGSLTTQWMALPLLDTNTIGRHLNLQALWVEPGWRMLGTAKLSSSTGKDWTESNSPWQVTWTNKSRELQSWAWQMGVGGAIQSRRTVSLNAGVTYHTKDGKKISLASGYRYVAGDHQISLRLSVSSKGKSDGLE